MPNFTGEADAVGALALHRTCGMKDVERARLRGQLDQGVELECGGGQVCRVLLPLPGLARVVFEPSGGFRCARSWMVSGEAGVLHPLSL